MQPKISIITVNFNGKKFLKDFFESLRNLQYDNFELIFVDNASADGSAKFAQESWPDIKIIYNQENLGFSRANNEAVKQANGEYLFFLNNDTKVHAEALKYLVKKIESNPKIGICGCKMMSYDGSKNFHTGIGIDIFGFPIVNNKVFYAEGSALLIRKQLFEAVAGFDPQYFMFHEDIDLAWKVWLLGYHVTATPEAIVYHSVGASAGGAAILNQNEQYQSTYFRRYLSERNNIRTLLKNYSLLLLSLVLPLYLLINLCEISLFLFFLKPRVAFCYLKAYCWNIVKLKDTIYYRTIVQRFRKISDREILTKMYFGIGKYTVFRSVKIPVFK